MAVRYEADWKGLFPAFHQLISRLEIANALYRATGAKRTPPE
jgi:hypothetical protein